MRLDVAARAISAFRDGGRSVEAETGALLAAQVIDDIHAIAIWLGVVKP